MSQQQLATNQASPVVAFKNYLNSGKVQALLKNRLSSDKMKTDFMSSVIEIVTGSPELQQCNPQSILSESLKAASIHLPLNKALGRCYVVPFKNKGVLTATMVIGYKGYIQLAKNSGKYRNINADVVYEGQITYTNYLTGEIKIDHAPTSDKVVGFFAYIEELNGFNKTLFMTIEQIAHYAKTYVPYLKFNNKVTEDTIKQKLQNHATHGPEQGIGWMSDSVTMAKKTCLRQLLTKWGNLSIEEQEAIANDVSYDTTITRDVEDAKAEEIFTPADEGNASVAEAAPTEPSATEQQTDNVEESNQEVDPFPGE